MKTLAIFGGTPVRTEKIYYGKQSINDDDVKAVVDTLKGAFITQGPAVDKLEQDLCDYTGAKYAVCISNGTAALHVACLALGIKEGDEVITSPITFAASANCALYCGATPVFADINPDTYNIDPEEIRKKITKKTKAVVAVDFTGQPAELDEIKEICKEFNLYLIEDAAHSIGSTYKGKMIGGLADVTTFSFHPVKTITGGEGGAMLTNDEETYKKLSLFRTHGICRENFEYESDGPWYYEQQELGYNYRLTDFQAALISSQLSRIEEFSRKRKEIVNKYDEALSGIPEIMLQKTISEANNCKHLYIIRLNLEKLNCTRLEFFNAMTEEGIQPQVHYIPVYYFPYYTKLGYKKGLCPRAEQYYEECLSIPLYPDLTQDDTDDVIEAIKKLVFYYRKEAAL